MSAALEQMQLRFVPEEDRLLLRIRTTDRAEFRFWLTRRFVKLLWGVLQRLMESTEHARAQVDPHSRREVVSFQHEHAMRNSDFSTPYREAAAHSPLGPAPLLLSRIRLREDRGAARVLCLHPERGRGIEVAMNETLLHSFSHLLADTARAAQWDLHLQQPAPPAGTAGEPRRVN